MRYYNKTTLVTAVACSLFGCTGDVTRVDLASVDGVNVEQLYIVDCLLPSSVRQLGAKLTYLGARRVIKTSGTDCGLRGGEYVAYNRANYETALNVWLPLAKANDSKAQVYVGEIYEKGLGTQPNYAQAAFWYQQAATLGDARGKMNLGSLYERGLGVPKNPAQALNLYRDASGLGERQVEFVSAEQRQQRVAQTKQLAQLQRETQLAQGSITQLQRELQQLELEADAMRRAPSKVETRIETRTVVVRDPIQEQVIQQLNAEIAALKNQVSKTQVKIIKKPEDTKLQEENTRLLKKLEEKENEITLKQKQIDEKKVASHDSQSSVVEPEKITIIETKIKKKKKELAEEEEKASKLSSAKEIESNGLRSSSLQGVSFGQYYAVVIGNNNYTNMNSLQTAENDAQAVASVLKNRYGFNTIVLANAPRGTMLAAFESLRKRLTENDNLLIYYAGHGELKNGQGFWLPTDAQAGDDKTWISNAQVTNFIDAMPAKHVLVIADSCYSGTLSQSSIPRPALAGDKTRAWFDAVARAKVRIVMSSGGIRPVSDTGSGNHSVFAAAFLKTLENAGAVQEGAGLYQAVRDQIGSSQTPLYAPIRFAGHEAGDFIFVKGGQLASNTPEKDNPKEKTYTFYAIYQRWLPTIVTG